MRVLDTLVLGKGPSALAVAAGLVRHGLDVGVLGPAGPVHWPAQYGAWADELAPADRTRLARFAWPEAVVAFGGGEQHVVPRPYVRIDKDLLRDELVARCEDGGVRWLDGRAAEARHDAAGSTVVTTDGAEIRARLVVDATGHRPVLVERGDRPRQGFQTAFGCVIEYDGPLFPADRALLMDWDDTWLPADERGRTPPSFLYAMPLGRGRLFVEETVLVGRPAVPFPALERRLRLRMLSLGIPMTGVSEVERCWIPMGGPLPRRGQRVVAFGGAAGMVHPATGYMLARVLERAPEAAEAIARELGRSGADPAAAAAAVWEAVWPEDRRHRHTVFCFGMEVLLRLSPEQNREFFAGFFRLARDDWEGYFSDRLSAPQLRAAMARLFLLLPAHVRRTLAGTALSRPGVALAKSLVQQLRA